MTVETVAPRLVQLIEDLTRLTGESPEIAVEIALRERLRRLETPVTKEMRRARVYALVQELQTHFKEHPEAAVDHGELLYGEHGLPRNDL
jgi:hypothetical protein